MTKPSKLPSLLTAAFHEALKSNTPQLSDRRLAYVAEIAKVLVERLRQAVADGDCTDAELVLALVGAARVIVATPPSKEQASE